MSINMDSDGPVDYSHFESQMAVLETQLDPTGDGARLFTKADVEPLRGQGGLSNNEVAELVYLETQVGIEVESESADQDVASDLEARGVVGINLPADESAFPARSDIQDPAEVVESQNDSGNLSQNVESITDSAYLQQFQTYGAIPADDETNGVGSNGSNGAQTYEKQYRNLTGRGPVLDQNDDLTLLNGIVAGDSIIPVNSVVRVHCLWDIAETEDSGRRFSVPMN